ncbi:glycosyltransferase family 4 protein [Aquabacterium sp.]|uniref:glycosyltransferase family 4 protein n=1 Tax=Aquabacterium sp. TaxID=1872578 RepID=UPI003784B29E
MQQQVAIVQRRLTHYRVPLFELMREQLGAQGVRLRLLVGQPTPDEQAKHDEGRIAWAESLPTRYAFGDRLCWLSFGARLQGEALVVVPQENKLVYNLAALSVARPRRIAFWGHGRNMQSRAPEGWRERFKQSTIRAVDWWFAYTQLTVPLLQAARFDAGRITVLDNAVDTRTLAQQWQAAAAQRDAVRARLQLEAAAPVGVFVGSLYPDKRLPFLLQCAARMRERLPGFQLLIVGDGPSRDEVQRFAAQQPWVRWLGMLRGAEKAEVLAVGDLLLNPGLVGLGILDAFACRIPMVTTDCGIHSPEICYLESGVNGLMTANDEAAYVEAVLQLLTNPEQRARLAQGLQASARRYTIENMAGHFCDGILRCIELAPSASRVPA